MHRIVRLAKISCCRSKSNIMPLENFKFAENVAHFLILNRNDGGKRYVILPMIQPSRLKTSFKNVNWRPELVKENQLGVISKEKRAFYDSLPILNSEHISGPKYYFEDGLRKVNPYLATYRSVVKSRSFPGANMPLSKYLTTRFTNNSPILLELEVKTGQIAVNLELVSRDYIVREGDVITRTGHLHETPILDRRLRIVHEDSNYLVVDKPSSWPVHSCGTFRQIY
ncbi:RNA pseudouridylate synthase domain-containing protein 2 isoform X3 [Eurytemora carolleeae]|uniref:RNA pseudouridylate synthase domain-containing protein 2 isoform X1 n=1 Tax=Eurytemora carolleeae TaxID=1294199 RepID=UPI000C787B3C|nr:RNA pseudouridylate synthase domain-containing protein 2 isoform X1 [Eurytemora carolleeae]XP_023345262.1 RNA pseudouridylate synthase domain-containing protein 2 isoform X2 [Eurytemora carolleeae]XP_023345263.1 RNA pseudouridylate synthase domain-containing protein 2 isoform X3 [Eurytemora carolleeae]|eukprot:XP_023345261.1 RNA pseudouridylate synthase domain-containing protein 2-like isoform X1 [Eurytemora affinis]